MTPEERKQNDLVHYNNIIRQNTRYVAEQTKGLQHIKVETQGDVTEIPTTAGPSKGFQLWDAARRGDLAVVNRLIAEGAPLDYHDPNGGSTALQAATACRKLEVVKALIDAGADVNALDCNGATVLMYASKFGLTDVARWALEAGADTRIKLTAGPDKVSLVAHITHHTHCTHT